MRDVEINTDEGLHFFYKSGEREEIYKEGELPENIMQAFEALCDLIEAHMVVCPSEVTRLYNEGREECLA